MLLEGSLDQVAENNTKYKCNNYRSRTVKEFAPGYERNEDNLILFSRDTDIRADMFPALDPTTHVAKANLWMVMELVDYVSEVGEHILDPFAGTGTIMCAATTGRQVTCVELEEPYLRILDSNVKMLKYSYQEIENRITVVGGDSFKLLPIPDYCDHMIFSPPYPMGLKKKGTMDKTSVDLGYASATDYSASPDNFTNLNTFLYHQRIELFYRKCLQTVRPGGTMTIIIKDRMEQGKRQYQPERTIKDCVAMGWELSDRFKWLARGGGYSAINRAAGLETVDEEDLLIFRRPK